MQTNCDASVLAQPNPQLSDFQVASRVAKAGADLF